MLTAQLEPSTGPDWRVLVAAPGEWLTVGYEPRAEVPAVGYRWRRAAAAALRGAGVPALARPVQVVVEVRPPSVGHRPTGRWLPTALVCAAAVGEVCGETGFPVLRLGPPATTPRGELVLHITGRAVHGG